VFVHRTGKECAAVELTTVLYDVADRVATITLNRPDARNAATFEMEEELVHCFATADDDPAVGCIVLTGAGKGFCAGDDVTKAWGDPRMEATLAELAGPNPPVTPLVAAMLACDTPTLAAVNGAAVGIGMDMALLCDLRIASEHARFAQLFVKLGLVCDVTGLWLLPQIVGRARAAELLLTGDMVDAAAAQELGIVSAVVAADELLPAAHERARRIAANPPLAVRAIKQGLRLAAGRTADDLPALARFVGNNLSTLFTTADHHEAVQAFLERREGHFTGN
jgi:enoyl-CoA hydratase/carnithine racemase